MMSEADEVVRKSFVHFRFYLKKSVICNAEVVERTLLHERSIYFHFIFKSHYSRREGQYLQAWRQVTSPRCGRVYIGYPRISQEEERLWQSGRMKLKCHNTRQKEKIVKVIIITSGFYSDLSFLNDVVVFAIEVRRSVVHLVGFHAADFVLLSELPLVRDQHSLQLLHRKASVPYVVVMLITAVVLKIYQFLR